VSEGGGIGRGDAEKPFDRLRAGGDTEDHRRGRGRVGVKPEPEPPTEPEPEPAYPAKFVIAPVRHSWMIGASEGGSPMFSFGRGNPGLHKRD